MQTNLSEQYRLTPSGQEAEAILRSCVHCGFCTATCPTYQLLGDELDGPRGRIYLIKELLEGEPFGEKTQLHLDRCLTCRACETTCPSGVRYGRLLDIGRVVVEKEVPRPLPVRLKRMLLRKVIPFPKRLSLLLSLAHLTKKWLPENWRQLLPNKLPALPAKSEGESAGQHSAQMLEKVSQSSSGKRKLLVLGGCAQSVTTPNTNRAASRVLSQLGIELIDADEAGCCGAVSYHLSAEEEGLAFMRRNIDAWWPYIEYGGVEGILITASGCGALVKEYGELLKDDRFYAEKAARISAMSKDIAELLASETEALAALLPNRLASGHSARPRVAFHSPCTLQHAQQINGVVESILQNAGFVLTTVNDAHLCCGSAGTYSVLQPELSQQLLDNKLSNLEQEQPDVIVTANVGCQMHLASEAAVPVKHWIELLDESLAKSA